MCSESRIPTMLKITEVAEMYNLPVHYVRVLVNSGEVVATRVGTKILVNADRFNEYLNTNTISHPSDSKENPAMRKPRIAPIQRRK